jgi:hypothetical protein
VVGEAGGERERSRPEHRRGPARANSLALVVPGGWSSGGAFSSAGPRGFGQRVPAIRAPARGVGRARGAWGVSHLRGGQKVGRTRVGSSTATRGCTRCWRA